MSSVAALNLPPATVDVFKNFFAAKIMRAVAAAENQLPIVGIWKLRGMKCTVFSSRGYCCRTTGE
jgi:hypothetical protein